MNSKVATDFHHSISQTVTMPGSYMPSEHYGVYIDTKVWSWELALRAAKFKKDFVRLHETAITSSISKMTLIIVHGVGQQHDQCLTEVLRALQEKGIILHPDKCHLGQPQLKWFGYIFSKDGISLDPEERSIIKNWPAPKSSSEVKSFLWTIQCNSKLLGGKPGELSYSEVTEPLQALTRKMLGLYGEQENQLFLKN